MSEKICKASAVVGDGVIFGCQSDWRWMLKAGREGTLQCSRCGLVLFSGQHLQDSIKGMIRDFAKGTR